MKNESEKYKNLAVNIPTENKLVLDGTNNLT